MWSFYFSDCFLTRTILTTEALIGNGEITNDFEQDEDLNMQKDV